MKTSMHQCLLLLCVATMGLGFTQMFFAERTFAQTEPPRECPDCVRKK